MFFRLHKLCHFHQSLLHNQALQHVLNVRKLLLESTYLNGSYQQLSTLRATLKTSHEWNKSTPYHLYPLFTCIFLCTLRLCRANGVASSHRYTCVDRNSLTCRKIPLLRVFQTPKLILQYLLFATWRLLLVHCGWSRGYLFGPGTLIILLRYGYMLELYGLSFTSSHIYSLYSLRISVSLLLQFLISACQKANY